MVIRLQASRFVISRSGHKDLTFTTMAGLRRHIARLFAQDPDQAVMFSSSVDFPEEYTKNKSLIKLARRLRP